MMTRTHAALAALGLVIVALAACGDNGFEVSDQGYEIPAAIEDLRRLADTIAKDWDENAYLWTMGGGVTVLDSTGRGYNHTFRYYSIPTELVLDLHFFAGAHWAETTNRPRPEAPAPLFGNNITSGVLDPARVHRSTEVLAMAIEAVSDSVLFPPEIDEFSVRLVSNPVWPERIKVTQLADSLAWRVDFLKQNFGTIDNPHPPEWWSWVRVYVHPTEDEIFEVIDPSDRPPQKYPLL